MTCHGKRPDGVGVVAGPSLGGVPGFGVGLAGVGVPGAGVPVGVGEVAGVSDAVPGAVSVGVLAAAFPPGEWRAGGARCGGRTRGRLRSWPRVIVTGVGLGDGDGEGVGVRRTAVRVAVGVAEATPSVAASWYVAAEPCCVPM